MLESILLLLTAVCLAGACNECPPECEIKCNSATDPCDKKPIDVVILVDGSESIESRDFNLSLQWVLTTVKRLKPADRDEGLQVSLVQFSTDYTLHLQETLMSDPTSDFENTVLNIQKKSSGTDTYGALNFVNTDVVPQTRQNTFKFLITLTDGRPIERSDSYVNDVIATAQQNFNVMLAIGVGDKIVENELKRLTHNADRIKVPDFLTLQDDIVSGSILNSTRKDCIRVCACCNTNSKTSLTVDYCLHNVSGLTVDPSIIDNFQLTLAGNNGLMQTKTNPADKCSAEFQGLNLYTEYNINVNAVLKRSDVIVRDDNVTCCTKGCIEIIPKCENSTETSLNISYELKVNGSISVSEYIKEFKITISPHGTGSNLLTKNVNERTAGFGGLTNGTKYTITITPIFINEAEGKKKVEANPASINCSTSNCPLCLPKPLNVVFLVDGSESILSNDFQLSLDWASNAVNIFRKLDETYEYSTPEQRREMRITVVQYSDTARMEHNNLKIEPSSSPINIHIDKQMKEGTKPYNGLRFVNNNVAINKTFFNVLVAFNDGHSPSEDVDMGAINTAKNTYDKILAVGVGDTFDMTQVAFMQQIAHNTEPFHIDVTKPFDNITECIKKDSHEDCIIFHAWCECSETRTEILLQYNYTLLGSLTKAGDLISEYIITMDGRKRFEALDTKSALFHESTGWPLSLHTIYPLGIDGRKIPYKIGAVIPASVNCTTRAIIRPTVTCSALDLTSVTVNIGVDSSGFREDFSVIQNYFVSISAPGATPNPQPVEVGKQPYPFTGLSSSTPYTITVKANKAENVCGLNESDSVVCTTEADTCEKQPIDLVFLIDGSESIEKNLFEDGLVWTSDTANRFNQKDRDETLRVVAIQFSDISREEFDVTMQATGTITDDVDDVIQMRSATKTYSGLRFISNNVTPRTDSCKVLVTVSDGDSTEPVDQTVIDSIKNDYDVMIAAGYAPIVHEARLQELSTVGKPIAIQDTTTISTIVSKTLDTCCRKELTKRVNIVVFCEATTNTIEVSYHSIPTRLGKDSSQIQNYQVKISGDGQEKTSPVKSVTETTASFTGLKASTEYVIQVTGQPVDGSKVEVVTAYLTCTTKDPCSPSPCQNRGDCKSEADGGYKCDCLPGWTGTNCENDDVIKPVVECVFTSDAVVVVAFKVNPAERGYNSSLIDSYSFAISPSGTGTNRIIKLVGDLTAVFTGLAQSTDYSITVNINKADDANIDVQEGSATCKTKAMDVQPPVTDASQPQTNAPSGTSVVSTSTRTPPLTIETTPSVSIGSSTGPSENTSGSRGATGDGDATMAVSRPSSQTANSLPSAQQPQDQCQTPIIVLAVLLVIAVIVALAFGIAYVRKGRRLYNVSGGTTD